MGSAWGYFGGCKLQQHTPPETVHRQPTMLDIGFETQGDIGFEPQYDDLPDENREEEPVDLHQCTSVSAYRQ